MECSLRGKKGQAVLKELEAALVALPEKRLIEGALYLDGQVCALGALMLKRETDKRKSGLEPWFAAVLAVAWLQKVSNKCGVDSYQAVLEAQKYLHTTRALAARIAFSNDEDCQAATPEVRYEKMLAWVRREIVPAEAGAL